MHEYLTRVPPLRTIDRNPVPEVPWLTELHLHLGGAVAPHILYALAMEQGIKLPVRDYFEFVELVSSSPDKVKSLDDYLAILHQWTERIQSSPAAVERAVYEVLAKEYRGSKVRQMELRFNPMKRNLGGERDLDHIIHAAIRGLDQACLAYGIKGGLIFCLAREFSPELNSIIVEKAIRYRDRGVVGIDLAGTEKSNVECSEKTLHSYANLFIRAREAGLQTTAHTGETANTGPEGIQNIVREFKVSRIGHGIQAANSPETLKILREEGIVLEICPTSNLHTKAVKDIEDLRRILNTLKNHNVLFTINTDATYTLGTDLCREIQLLVTEGILDNQDVINCFETASNASFLS